MPKKLLKLDDFSGGTNGYTDPQNILDNELAQCSGFKAEPGEVLVVGDMQAAYTIGSGDTAAGENVSIEPGYGLFAFSSDYDKDGDLASTNYFVLQNGHRISIYDDVDHTWPVIVDDTIAFVNSNPDTITDSGNRFVTAGFKSGMKILVSGSLQAANNTYHTIASVAAGTLTLTDDSALSAIAAGASTITIVGIHIDLGTSHSSNAMASFKPCFFFVDGALRVSPGNFDKVDAGSETDSPEGTSAPFDRIGQLAFIQADDTSKVEAGDIAVIDGLEYFIVVATGVAPVEHIAVRNTTGMFLSKFANTSTIYVMPDTKWRGIVQRRCFANLTTVGTFTEWYTCPMSPKPPTSDPTTTDMDDRLFVEVPFSSAWATGNFSAADGYYSGQIVIGTNEAEANVNGSWDTTIRLWITALYDDVRQESQPFRIHASTTETIAAGYELGVNVVVQYSDDGAPAYVLNKRVVGARLYYEDIVDELGVLYQLLDIDFERGCKKAESESYTQWVERTANRDAICPTAITAHGSRTGTDAFTWAAPPKAFTYEINTGYSATTNIHARFKTAVVANRRLYVGNVYQGGKANGDRMLKSPPNKFDILPETSFIDVAVGDGDEIVKLETFADRLLQFKKRTLYIINIGGEVEFLESQHSNMGVENPSQTCLTEYGIAWVNRFGVYLYDGQGITELSRGKLKAVDTTSATASQELGRARALNVTESNIPLIGYHSLNKWLVIHPNSFGQVTGTTYAAVDSNPDTITDSGNGFITAGFKAGDVITVSGSSESGNNTTHIVDTVVAGTLTLSSASTLTADGAGDTWVITNNTAAEAWIYDFKNGSWTWSQEFTAAVDHKTNLINTHDNELVFAAGINSSNTPDFFKLRSATADPLANKLFLLTKDFTLEIPGVKKNVYSVYVTYSAGGDTNIEADLIYRHSTGETTVAMQEASGSTYYDDSVGFKTTSGAKATIELVPSAAVKNANSFQFKIANPDATHDVSDDFRLYSISFRYRTKGVR